ncbi:MAG TPA: oligopeptide/dipeptide ABC transporter ATP-binding protein [Solirubrobacteraceae bacterium]|nr:oligopeptide/dipeptide ABC transporter ATP-binding protein [Solirubrobacteraceae bacterium]
MTDLLQLDGVSKSFRLHGGRELHAVSDVTLTVPSGSTLGLVGESGCGKSTLARCIVGLHQVDSGSIRFDGRELVGLRRRGLRDVRRELVMVFQDPFASLNPRRRVGEIVAAPLDIHDLCRGAERNRRVAAMLERVGLESDHARRYPHEFSGGQRQRIGLARALITEPKLVVCDEPVSALDVSVQAQILNLLADLQAELELTLVFIAHDLGVVRHIARDVAVMYLGRIVEQGPADDLFADPHHPYSSGLLASVPVPDPEARIDDAAVLTGDVPSTTAALSGCAFHPRCAFADERCRADVPELRELDPGRVAACHHPLHAPERIAGATTSTGASR